MLYTDDFVTSLPNDAAEAIHQALQVLHKKVSNLGAGHPEFAPSMIEARDLILALFDLHKFEYGYKISREGNPDINVLVQELHHLSNQIEATKKAQESDLRKKRFSTLLGGVFHYDFSEADTKRLQQLINELRDFITIAENFDDDYKRRLLLRLEELQKEIHKRISDVHRFYGLIGDAGVVLGKLGKDAKPFVDRVKEIAQIVWRAQATAEQLPASASPALLIAQESATET